MNPHRRVAQPRTSNRLPGSIDRQLLDLVAQPVQSYSRADFEIDAGSLGNTDFVGGGDFDDVQCRVVRGQARDPGRKVRRHACLNMLLADLLEAFPVRAAEQVGDLSFELTDTFAEFRDGRFNAWGTILATILLGAGQYGILLSGAPVWAPDAFYGVALIGAVAVTSLTGNATSRWRGWPPWMRRFVTAKPPPEPESP